MLTNIDVNHLDIVPSPIRNLVVIHCVCSACRSSTHRYLKVRGRIAAISRSVIGVITVGRAQRCCYGCCRSLHRREHQNAEHHKERECNEQYARHNSFLVVCLILVILFHTVFLHKFGFVGGFVKVCLQVAFVVHSTSLLLLDLVYIKTPIAFTR